MRLIAVLPAGLWATGRARTGILKNDSELRASESHASVGYSSSTPRTKRSSRVIAAESANDGRQPNLLEKKTNMSQGCTRWAGLHAARAGTDPSHPSPDNARFQLSAIYACW